MHVAQLEELLQTDPSEPMAKLPVIKESIKVLISDDDS